MSLKLWQKRDKSNQLFISNQSIDETANQLLVDASLITQMISHERCVPIDGKKATRFIVRRVSWQIHYPQLERSNNHEALGRWTELGNNKGIVTEDHQLTNLAAFMIIWDALHCISVLSDHRCYIKNHNHPHFRWQTSHLSNYRCWSDAKFNL